jgi:hypothetical protein
MIYSLSQLNYYCLLFVFKMYIKLYVLAPVMSHFQACAGWLIARDVTYSLIHIVSSINNNNRVVIDYIIEPHYCLGK